MLEKARKLYYKLLKWWRWRHIRRKQQALGVAAVNELHRSESDRHTYPEVYLVHAYIAPPSRVGGSICGMREKLGGLFTKWMMQSPSVEETRLPGWDELMKALETAKNDSAPGN